VEKHTDLVDLSGYPKRIELSDGTRAWLRPMRKNDLDRLLTFFEELPARNRQFFKHDVTRREVIADWCRDLDYDRVLPILAVVGKGKQERVVADATLHTDRHGWATHVARVRWVVARDMIERGLGRIILRDLLERAAARGIQKIQADIRADNQKAVKLLRRLGFRKEATFRKHAMSSRGRLHDVLIYANNMDDLWQKMEDLNIDSDWFMMP